MNESKMLFRDMRLLGKEMGLWKYGSGYKYYFSSLYRNNKLGGKNILEIGCSDGRHCITARIYGANHVIGLEPVADGSGPSKHAFEIFNKFVSSLKIKNVDLIPLRIQDYQHDENYFDLILSVASINHWDEDACLNLQKSEEARDRYLTIFRNLHKMMKPGGKLIIIESSNRNLFGDLGIKNPLHPRIHWSKHQSPEYWVSLLSLCGFGETKIRWLLDYRLKQLEKLIGNKLTSYCLGSVFRLEMTCNK